MILKNKYHNHTIMSITLNVSGKIFKVSRDILCKSELFNGMLTDCEINDEVVIDRSAKLFKHVHAYLLDDKYPYPRKYHSELDYYLVPYNIDSLYDPTKKWKEYDTQIKKIESILEIVFSRTMPGKTYIRCQFPRCDSPCNEYGTCRFHRYECCHFFEEDSQDDDRSRRCPNEVYADGLYCKDHIREYLKY